MNLAKSCLGPQEKTIFEQGDAQPALQNELCRFFGSLRQRPFLSIWYLTIRQGSMGRIALT
jgi:hypothetical protein